MTDLRRLFFILFFFISPSLAAQDILIDGFEGPGMWTATVVKGKGLVIQTALRNSGPYLVTGEKFALGLKINCLIPGEYTLHLTPPKPLSIPHNSRRLSLWIQGENRSHRVSILFSTAQKESAEEPLEVTNFVGWKQSTCLIPLRQKGPLTIDALILSLDPLDLGPEVQYLYFDHLTIQGDQP